MATNNYVGNHKQWDHVGSITPDIEISEGIRPAEEFKPAAWLPVQRFDKYYEEYFVVSAGKVVALDNDGRVVPAQFATSTVEIDYTDADVESGTISVKTGVTVTQTEADASAFAVSTVSAFLGGSDALAVSAPIGIAPYNYWQWAGGDGFNPSQYRRHNHNLQSQVAVLCDYYIELPLVPAVQAAAALGAGSKDASLNIADFANAMADIATNTGRTPVTFTEGAGAPGDVATRFVNEVATRADIISSGDFFITTAGVVSVYSTGAIGATDYEIAYYKYATGGSVSTYACATGDVQPGDFVMFDDNSNMVTADVSGGTDKFDVVIGQVLARDSRFPKDALEKVRTAYAGLGVEKQMPGSANGGVPHNISYSGAADTVVRINLINR